MANRLEGKSVVIIGGTGGIGASAVRACIREGACVVAVGRDSKSADALCAELGPKLRIIIADATAPQTAPEAIGLCQKTFGRVHGLYHVAGGSGRRFGDGPLHELTDEGWSQTLNLNLTSVFLSNRDIIRYYIDLGIDGAVLNCGSILGSSPSPHFFATHAYATAKSALIGLTTAAAAHYARYNIRFNLLAPGLIATPMSQRAQDNKAIQSFIRSKQPLDGGRIGLPADLDTAVLWLLSDESRFVTGQVIAIDGGWSVSEGQISNSSQ